MNEIKQVSGRAVVVRGHDIDTDRIVPARYLKEITFNRMGEYPFFDERHDTEGNTVDHPFNEARFQGAEVLLVNRNFGCGSSREHAPQALYRWGIKVIVGESFGPIFAGSSVLLGMPTVMVSPEDIGKLMTQWWRPTPKSSSPWTSTPGRSTCPMARTSTSTSVRATATP